MILLANSSSVLILVRITSLRSWKFVAGVSASICSQCMWCAGRSVIRRQKMTVLYCTVCLAFTTARIHKYIVVRDQCTTAENAS